jgi:hypothetical protein
VLTAILVSVMSSAMDVLARWWIWFSLLRISCDDG